MKAAQIVSPRKVTIVDIEEPEIKNDEPDMLKVRIERACLCGSDSPWFAYDHRASANTIPTRWSNPRDLSDDSAVYPLKPGLAMHECLGTVVKSTSPRFKTGDLALAMPPGQAGLCEYVCFPARQVVCLPRDVVPLEQILMTQPLGTVIWACKRLGCIIDLHTAVVGAGPMGLLISHMLSNLGAKTVISLDKLDYRLEVARKMRSTHTVNVDKEDPLKVVREITDGKMADVVFEAVGHQDLDYHSCLNLLHPLGSLVGFGMPDRVTYADFPIWDLLTKNLTLIGSEGPDPIPNYALARDMIAQGRIDVSPIISHILPFQEIQKAYDLFVNREDRAIKVVINYDTLRA
jgi:threonine dehydrogenase-like Zn-dependent dehydrogenase